MRIGPPASRAIFKARISVFYAVWAFAAPLLALSLRNAYILDLKFFEFTASYCLITGSFSLLAFLVFRLNDSLPQYFSGLGSRHHQGGILWSIGVLSGAIRFHPPHGDPAWGACASRPDPRGWPDHSAGGRPRLRQRSQDCHTSRGGPRNHHHDRCDPSLLALC